MLQSQATLRGLVPLSVCRRAISTLVHRHPLAGAGPQNSLQPSIPAFTRVAAFSTSSGTSSNSSSPPEGSPGMAGYVKRTNRMDPPDEHTTQDRRTSEPEPMRSTGDEVETADTRVEMAFNKVTGAVKSAAQKVKDVLNREDPINEAGEEGYGSLDRFKDTINMSSARGREQLEGHKWQQDRDAKRIDPESITSAKSTARNKRETGTGSGDVSGEGTSASGDSMSKAADQVKQGVKGVAEKIGEKTEEVSGASGERMQKGAEGMTDNLKSTASKLSDKMKGFENRSADEANEQGKQVSRPMDGTQHSGVAPPQSESHTPSP